MQFANGQVVLMRNVAHTCNTFPISCDGKVRSQKYMRGKEQVAWLWRVARNKGVDAYRRSRVRQGLDLIQLTDYIEDNRHAPELIVLQREASAHLHTYLEKLSPIQWEVVRLRFAHGLRSPEIYTSSTPSQPQ